MNNSTNPIDMFIEEKVLEAYRPIIAMFRALVQKEFPILKEEMRGGTEKYPGVPVYRHNKIIITISPTKKGITFSFSEGKKFEDTYGLLEGVGNKTLNLRLTKVEEYDDDILRYYILQAIEHDRI
jgi:hypothetical protein